MKERVYKFISIDFTVWTIISKSSSDDRLVWNLLVLVSPFINIAHICIHGGNEWRHSTSHSLTWRMNLMFVFAVLNGYKVKPDNLKYSISLALLFLFANITSKKWFSATTILRDLMMTALDDKITHLLNDKVRIKWEIFV